MNLINKILFESEEEKNLFQPRRIENRLDNISDPLEKKMYSLNEGDKINVYVRELKVDLEAIITKIPQFFEHTWFVEAYFENIFNKSIKDLLYVWWDDWLKKWTIYSLI